MIETTKDIFWLIFGLSLGILTVFICWAIYYWVQILRNANKTFTSIREKVELVDKILKIIKEKLEKSTSHLSILTDSAIKLIGFMMEKQKKSIVKKKKE